MPPRVDWQYSRAYRQYNIVSRSTGIWEPGTASVFPIGRLYKGILSVNLEVEGVQIIVLNTHMNANYYGVWQRTNPLARIEQCQVQQLNRAIHSFPDESLVIVCGDFNFPRDLFLYEELVSQNNLLDPLINDLRPSYRPFPLVPTKWRTSLDYMLIRKPAHKNFQVLADLIVMEDTTKKSPIQRFLTDHNALTLQIKWDLANPNIMNEEHSKN